ncbi:MAG: hypothetical protein ACLTAF_13725 [Blautia coccoides]
MKQIVTGGQMKLLDSYTIEKMGIPSLVLMERAALSVCQALREEEFPLEKVLVLCGTAITARMAWQWHGCFMRQGFPLISVYLGKRIIIQKK